MAATTISTAVATVTREITSTSVVVDTLSVTIPLTTAFTPPSSCLAPTLTISPLGYDSFEDGDLIRGLDPRCFPGGFVPTTAVTAPSSTAESTAATATTLTPLPYPTSRPPQTSSASSSNLLATTTAVVSVSSTATTTETSLSTTTITQIVFSGAACPASYTVAEYAGTVYASQPFNLLTCCPSQMSLTVQSGSSLRCIGQSMSVTVARIRSTQETSTATTSTLESFRIRAPAVVALSPTSTPPSSGPSSNTLPSSPSGGLSTGAKAGIGVGVGIGGLILIVGIVLLALFLRRRRRSSVDAESKTEATTFDKAELPGEGKAIPELSAQNQILEADPKEKPQEMDSTNDKGSKSPQELESNDVRAELEGDPVPERPN